jgi:hypothetical protein
LEFLRSLSLLLIDLFVAGSVIAIPDVVVVALHQTTALQFLALNTTLKATLRQSVAWKLPAELKTRSTALPLAMPGQSLA